MLSILRMESSQWLDSPAEITQRLRYYRYAADRLERYNEEVEKLRGILRLLLGNSQKTLTAPPQTPCAISTIGAAGIDAAGETPREMAISVVDFVRREGRNYITPADIAIALSVDPDPVIHDRIRIEVLAVIGDTIPNMRAEDPRSCAFVACAPSPLDATQAPQTDNDKPGTQEDLERTQDLMNPRG